MFEKCPKCGNWSCSLNRARGVMECLRTDCNYREKVDVEAYLKKDNYLNKVKLDEDGRVI